MKLLAGEGHPKSSHRTHARHAPDCVRVAAIAHRSTVAKILTVRQSESHRFREFVWRWRNRVDFDNIWYVQSHIYRMEICEQFVADRKPVGCVSSEELTRAIETWINECKAEGYTVGRTIEKE